MNESTSVEVIDPLQNRLVALIVTSKHVHRNVVGMHFVAIHEMLDPEVAAVRRPTRWPNASPFSVHR